MDILVFTWNVNKSPIQQGQLKINPDQHRCTEDHRSILIETWSFSELITTQKMICSWCHRKRSLQVFPNLNNLLLIIRKVEKFQKGGIEEGCFRGSYGPLAGVESSVEVPLLEVDVSLLDGWYSLINLTGEEKEKKNLVLIQIQTNVCPHKYAQINTILNQACDFRILYKSPFASKIS